MNSLGQWQGIRQVLVCIAIAGLVGCAAQNGGRAGLEGQTVETYAKGVYAYQAGESDAAAEALKQAINANPQLIMPRVYLGRIYKQQEDYAAAAEQYEVLASLDPYEIAHHYELGLSYQMLQRLREAVRSYQKALALDAVDFGSNMNLGVTHLALGNVLEAVQYTQKAATIRPESAEAQANLAVALDSNGEYARAESAYRKSLELAPLQVGTLVNYGNNLLAQGKWPDALQVFEQALKTEQTPYLHKRMGDALAMADRLEEALNQYEQALRMNPKYFSAMNETARIMIVQYQAGMELDEPRRDQALALWRQSLAIAPEQPRVKAALEHWEQRMFSK